jgi:hypothetical protein
MSLAMLPAELLEMVAMNLCYDDLYHFQLATKKVLFATSGVIFYCEYFKRKYPKLAIQKVYSERFTLSSWEEIIRRLYDDMDEFTSFFYETVKTRECYSVLLDTPTIGCEAEIPGAKIGKLFADYYCAVRFGFKSYKIDEVHQDISDFKERKADLVKTKYWNRFEELFYTETVDHVTFWNENKDHRETYIDWAQRLEKHLDFAKEKNYPKLAQEILKELIILLVKLAARNTLECGIVLQHLKHLLPQVTDYTIVGFVATCIKRPYNIDLVALGQIYLFLMHEIVGKRKSNYGEFFNCFVEHFINTFTESRYWDDRIKEYLELFKYCLKWRFVVPDGEWRYRGSEEHLLMMCFADEELREIFYPKGFYLDDSSRRLLVKIAHGAYFPEIMQACTNYLASKRNFCYTNEQVAVSNEIRKRRTAVESRQAL